MPQAKADNEAFPALPDAIAAFADTLVAKSPRTSINYLSALNRFRDYLDATGADPNALTTDCFASDTLERFYTWLLRTHGREHRTTAVTYASEVRAFFRFLDRRRWLHPDFSYERAKDGLRQLIGRVSYKTPRIDDAVALVVTHAANLPLPPDDQAHRGQRLEMLRDRALLLTLYATGMRRSEIASLSRGDIQDGRSPEGLITGKGEKERIVFFDEQAMAAIRAYLEARGDPYLPVFLRHDDGRGKPGPRGEHWRLSPTSVWDVVRRYGRLAGVEVTTHHLRHLKARVMLNAGAQLSEVQDLLGHASPATTKMIYAPYTKQHLREAFDKFSVPAADLARQLRKEK
ncbi:MAG: tyrosine-type recombinase/integrase [Chloroflexota bacterium]